MEPHGELYGDSLIGLLEAVWGEGWLSPGGPAEVDRILAGVDLSGLYVLDIGCGTGGIDLHLIERHGAGCVTGIDVEAGVIGRARQRAEGRGLSQRARFETVEPGPLPFADARFDIVFSKDAIVHIRDKHALMREVFRVLKPGGWFLASDWLIGHDGAPSPEMAAYIAAEGLDFGMASPQHYRAALEDAGFAEIGIDSRNAWYREVARRELAALQGPLSETIAARLGRDVLDHNIDIWRRMIAVLDSGEHCPTHLRGRKPQDAPMPLDTATSAVPPRKASREVRRQQLIEATIDTLAKRGYASTTLSDVAATAGLSGGIINFHFESKEKLLVETLKHLAEEYRANWQKALAEAGASPAEKLAALLTADFNPEICTPRKLAAWCAFWAEAPSRPTYLEHCGSNDEAYSRIVRELVSALIAEGGYGGDPIRIARALDAILEGLWLDMMTMAEPYTPGEAVESVLACLEAFFPRHFDARGPLRRSA